MTQISTSTNVLAENVRNLITFNHDQNELNKLVAPFKAASTSETVQAVVRGFAVYMDVRVTFPAFPLPSIEFEGRGGGLLTVGAAVDFGQLYYIDRARLFTDTTGFTFAFFLALHQIWFWDKSGNLLAYIEAVPAGTLNGTGGGTGTWK